MELFYKKKLSGICNLCYKSIKHASNTINLMQQKKHMLQLTSEHQKVIEQNVEKNIEKIWKIL